MSCELHKIGLDEKDRDKQSKRAKLVFVRYSWSGFYWWQSSIDSQRQSALLLFIVSQTHAKGAQVLVPKMRPPPCGSTTVATLFASH